MPEEERLRLRAIAERIELVRSWCDELDEPAFVADLLTRDAVAMSLMIIGETARRLSALTKSSAPEIPWPAIVSLRNRIAHGYETVDHKMVWEIVSHDLPDLHAAATRLLTP